MSPPPRIFGILARAAPVVALFRRGPARQVLLLSWDLRDDRVTPGQWLKGRIYERRGDLSPDGRHLIYFAMNGRWHGPLGGSWTAVSRLPWLTALHLYPWGHCWNGGGLFLDDRRYWLNGVGLETTIEASLIECGLRRAQTPPEGVTPIMGEDPVTYHPRLLRDGWSFGGRDARSTKGHLDMIDDKTVRPGWTLRKAFHLGSSDGRGPVYSESHALSGPEGPVPFAAEWAETRNSEILFACDGSVWRQGLHQSGPEPARKIADLAPMTFTEAEAPYAGVTLRDGQAVAGARR